MSRRKLLRSLAACATGLLLAGAFSTSWAGNDLPKTMTWTAFGTNSGGYASCVAVGEGISEAGYKIRVLPGKNDISRLTPVRTGRAQVAATGVGAFQAQEGVLDFGVADWGPQPLRILLMAWSDSNIALLATAKDANIRTPADLKGKRVAYVVGAPGLNQHMDAWLAYGNLSWNDVQKVTAPGWGASIQAMIDGKIDAAIAGSASTKLYELDSSPRGLYLVEAPANEKENWARFLKHAPWYVPHVATEGVGLSKEKPHVGGTFGNPVLTVYDTFGEDAAYTLVKLLHENYDKYKDGHPVAKGYAIDRQVFNWVVPYHAGAVKYFKEIGVWKDEDERNNQRLLKRQKILQEAWEKSGKGAGGYDKWIQARAAALKAGGFDPIWGN